MRRQCGRRRARRERRQPAPEGVQRVGIQHEGRADAGDEGVHERRRRLVAPETGPEHDRVGAGRQAEHLVGVARAVHHELGAPDRDLVADLGRDGREDDSGTRAQRARAASSGAPLVPGAPPTTRTAPASYFVPEGLRGGSDAARSEASIRSADGRGSSACGSPIGTVTTSPACERPGSIAVPSLRPWKQTVQSARIATPGTSPVVESTPLGISSANTGAP